MILLSWLQPAKLKMNKKRILIVTNLITIGLLFFVVFKEKYPQRIITKFSYQDTPVYDFQNNRQYNKEVGLFQIYKKKGNVVMLGNSITYRCDWNELLNRNDIINRGIDSDITEGFLNRIEYVINVEPKICFIMGGVNDILQRIDPFIINSNLEKISKTLIKNNIEPLLFSILYVAEDFPNFKRINIKIKETNLLISQSCNKNKIEYINLNEKLKNKGVLLKDYSFDGIHLTNLAYMKWGEIIDPIIERKLEIKAIK